MTEHPPAEAIAAYLCDGLPAPDRSALEAHLASCRPCRTEVTSARQLLEHHSVRRRWQMIVPAAAAAVLAIVLLGHGVLRPPVDREVVRGSKAANGVEVASSIQVLSPTNEATVPVRAVPFAWVGQPGRPLYRLILTEASGRAVWTQDTNDTTVTLPASVTLAPGRTYFWYVDALDSAGRTLTTGTRTFSTQP
jgi:hypothetical protein